MSADDEYNELEIETVAAIISAEHAERAEQCEGRSCDYNDCEGDYYNHHHSGGCLILIALSLGTAAFIVQVIFNR